LEVVTDGEHQVFLEDDLVDDVCMSGELLHHLFGVDVLEVHDGVDPPDCDQVPVAVNAVVAGPLQVERHAAEYLHGREGDAVHESVCAAGCDLPVFDVDLDACDSVLMHFFVFLVTYRTGVHGFAAFKVCNAEAGQDVVHGHTPVFLAQCDVVLLAVDCGDRVVSLPLPLTVV